MIYSRILAVLFVVALGTGAQAQSDTTLLPLFPPSPRFIKLGDWHATTASTSFFRFVNNSGAGVKIISHRFTDDTMGYTVSYWGYSKDTVLAANGSFVMSATYSRANNWYPPDTAQLVMMLSDGRETAPVTFQPTYPTKSVAADLLVGVQCDLGPNPAINNVVLALKGIRRASIHLYDESGLEVLTPIELTVGRSQANIPLEHLVAGRYFLRIGGESAIGANFQVSRSLVVGR